MNLVAIALQAFDLCVSTVTLPMISVLVAAGTCLPYA